MRVIATGKGYDGLNVREEGDEFEMPEGAKGSWFIPLDEDGKPEKPAKAEKPAKVGKQIKNVTLAGADDLA